MPVFRTQADATLYKNIRQRIPVLIDVENEQNPWQADVYRAFDLSNPKILGYTKKPSEINVAEIYTIPIFPVFQFMKQKCFISTIIDLRPMNNRAQTYGRSSDISDVREENKSDSMIVVHPRLWISKEVLYSQYRGQQPRWLLGYRNICRSTDERTMIAAILPLSATDYSVRLVFINVNIPISYMLILGNFKQFSI